MSYDDTVVFAERSLNLAGLPPAPAGMHYMPDGSLMSGTEHVDAVSTVVETGDILVYGAGASGANGVYRQVGTFSGKPNYTNEGAFIQWNPYLNNWQIGARFISWYYSNDDVATPDLATTWEVVFGFSTPPVPTVIKSLPVAYDNPVPNYQAALTVNSGQSDAFQSSRTSSPAVYSDIPLDLKIHPNLYDVRPLKDTRAVQQSVKNLVLSNFTDRPFQPYLGSNVTALLFEPADVGTAIALKEEIIRVLTDHEPRIANVTVQVFDNSDRNAYKINIGYTIVISDTNDNTEFYLERLR
jgi:phage baseplate assembly protein W